MIGARTFRFLGTQRELADPGGWNHPGWPKLWLYNLHYFDDLVADEAASRRVWHEELIDRWIVDNPPAGGNGWEPYPTSLRWVNWTKWALMGNGLSERARESLAVQARWLSKRLEVHLLGNHLWANAKALLFAGVFFEGREAQAWRRRGLGLLRRELHEQLLADGGHFERSPMYHAIVLEDVLDLIQLSQRFPGLLPAADVAAWRNAAGPMLRWLRVMSHPDGELAFFNDAAFGIAPNVDLLEHYARALGLDDKIEPLSTLEVLPDSGYARLEVGPAVLLVDIGAVGPDYLPGHAHADTLSCELSLHGRRILVNGGTSTYDSVAERVRQRGTAAHNTVAVDGEDSSEVWSSFRVARRARTFDVRWGQDGASVWVEASHDGYRRLAGDVVHTRRWDLYPGGLDVVDRLEGRWRSASANWLISPAVSLGADELGRVMSVEGRLCHFTTTSPAHYDRATWHPRFGDTRATQRIVVDFDGPSLTTRITW
jgi:uncharacterized heparinase superfamily protein